MKKLNREQLKTVKGGVGTPPGGGGSIICLFKSASCGDLCYAIGGAPFYSKSCGSEASHLKPSCGYTYQQVTTCPVS